jgi:hypothetical protein
MAYSQRDPNGSDGIHPIPKAYAGVVIVALLGLIVLNRLFGSVSVSGGIK